MIIKRFKVKIRREIGKQVKPEAEQIDGQIFTFIRGWDMEEGDPYPGETAWCPRDKSYPLDAPVWIASGDLEVV